MREWIVTRPRAEADELVKALTSAGVEARAIPCVERHHLDWPWPPPKGEGGWVMVTSVALADRLGPVPDHVRVAALKPKTSAVLKKHGLKVALEVEGGVEALAEALERTWSKEKRPKWFIHYPTSDVGVNLNEQGGALALLERFATVRRHVAYLSRAPKELKAQAAKAPADAGLIFFSPSAVVNWLKVAKQKPGAVLCHGSSTLAAYDGGKPSGWPRGELAEGDFKKAVLERERRSGEP